MAMPKATVATTENIENIEAQHDNYPTFYNESLSNPIARVPTIVVEATANERSRSFASTLRLYPKALGWSAAIAFAIIMEGFGTALLNSFFAFPSFQRDFGVRVGPGTYEVPVRWQTSLSNAAVATSIVGILISGSICEKYGYRKTLIAHLLFLSASIFGVFFPKSLPGLLVGQMLCGLAWGGISTLTISYAAEVLPVRLRGFAIASINLCWLLGQIIAQGALRGFISVASDWSYRIPFALQWAFILVAIVFVCLAPDSPWWLVQHARLEEARSTLQRLTRRSSTPDAEYSMTIMCHTDATEKILAKSGNARSYMDCFRGTNLRRTEIACMTFMIQNASGLAIIAFAAYFYNKIGFDNKQSFNLTIGMQSVAILGALLSFGLMQYIGRRRLFLIGLGLQSIILLVAGAVSTFKESVPNLWTTASMVILFIFVFDLMVAPMTYCIVAEIPSTRLRVKTVALARVAYNICALITNVLQTNMLNTLSWNWRGKSCFFWAVACLLCLVYCFFRLPETQGLTFLELDLLFEKRAHATKFAIVQRQLSDAGYFGMEENRVDLPTWVEHRPGSISHDIRPI